MNKLEIGVFEGSLTAVKERIIFDRTVNYFQQSYNIHGNIEVVGLLLGARVATTKFIKNYLNDYLFPCLSENKLLY